MLQLSFESQEVVEEQEIYPMVEEVLVADQTAVFLGLLQVTQPIQV